MHLFDWPFGDINPHSFDRIMADPPWRFLARSPKGEGKSAQAHYDTMASRRNQRIAGHGSGRSKLRALALVHRSDASAAAHDCEGLGFRVSH